MTPPLRLLVEQGQFDLIDEILSFCDKRSIFRVLFQWLQFYKNFISPNNNSEIYQNDFLNNVQEILDVYGFKFMQFRIWNVYRRVVEKFEKYIKLKIANDQDYLFDKRYETNTPWIRNVTEVKTLFHVYKTLTQLFITKDGIMYIPKYNQNDIHSQLETIKDCITQHLSLHSKLFNKFHKDMTLFEMYNQILHFEIQQLTCNFWKFNNQPLVRLRSSTKPIQKDSKSLLPLHIAFHMDDELMNDENYDRHNLLRDFEYCVYSEAGPLIPYCSLTISQTIIQGLNCRLKFARNESNTEMNFKNTFFKEGNYCEKIEENLDELWKNRDALYFSDAVIFLFDSMKLKEIKSEINLDTLETVELLPCLRRVILQYPFSPIVLVLSDIYTANEFENQISRTLLNFPHVTGVYEYAQDRTVLEVACNSALYGLRSCAQLHVDLTQQRKTCELQ